MNYITKKGKTRGGLEYSRMVYVDPMPNYADSDEWRVEVCGRCGGTGHLRHYSHVDGSRCFECGGGGGSHIVTHGERRKRDSKFAESANRAERKRVKKIAARDRQLEEFAKENDISASRLKALSDHNIFIDELLGKMYDYELSEKQLSALRDAVLRTDKRLREEQERDVVKSRLEPILEGRREMSVRIMSAVAQENTYGFHVKIEFKMFCAVLDEDGKETGYTLWSTVPRKLLDSLPDGETVESLRGSEYRIKGTVGKSHTDHAHGFMTRPTIVK